jgi:cytochrome c-type biogenesis protein CcmF
LFKSWTLLLSVLAFSLSLLGTFLVRSGVLISVHSFAADPTRGTFILAFLIVMIGGALTLYAWRAPLLKSNAGFDLASRESFLLFNNILLVIAAATVLGGTLAPLIADSLGLGTLSVGTPYFNPTFMLSMLPLLALLALGVQANWKRGRLGAARRTLLTTLIIAAIVGVIIVFGIYSHGKVLSPVAATLGVWIILTSLIDPIDRLRRKLSFPRGVLGMTVAHIGLGIFVISVTTVESFTVERDVALGRGERTTVGNYEFRFDRVKPVEGPNYNGVEATVVVTRHGVPTSIVYPQKRKYWVQGQVTTEAAIEMHHGSNVFVALGDDLGGGKWSLRFQIRPLVNFLWLGAFIMSLGGAIAATDRRYRLARAAVAPATVPGAVAGEGAR